MQACILCWLGRINEAAEVCERAEALARVHGENEVLTWLQLPRIQLDVILADPAAAREHARCALEAAERVATPEARMEALMVLCIAHRLNKQWEEAFAAMEAISAAVSGVHRSYEGFYRAELAEVWLGRGDQNQAEREAQAAVAVAHGQHSRCFEILANLALVHAQLRRSDAESPALVEQALARAQELINETGARFFQPDVHECRAHLARLHGDVSAARHEVDAARRLYAEIGATAQVERLAKQMDSAATSPGS